MRKGQTCCGQVPRVQCSWPRTCYGVCPSRTTAPSARKGSDGEIRQTRSGDSLYSKRSTKHMDPTVQQAALSDGFRILLLGVDERAAQGVCRCAWRLFDGGRLQDQGEADTAPAAIANDFASRLRRVITRVLAPPHVTVAFGRGWRGILDRLIPRSYLAELRVLDLQTTAALLADARRAKPAWDTFPFPTRWSDPSWKPCCGRRRRSPTRDRS